MIVYRLVEYYLKQYHWEYQLTKHRFDRGVYLSKAAAVREQKELQKFHKDKASEFIIIEEIFDGSLQD